MQQDVLAQLRSVDPSLLRAIVRQDQCSPVFEIMDWTVERLSSKGIVNPEGLFRFDGTGCPGQVMRPWSVVLKILPRPDDEEDPRDIWYANRELHVAQSGLLERLPGPLVAPRIYATSQHADASWIWMEHLGGATSQPWTLAHYAFAARQLGRFNAAYLTGAAFPDFPWLCREHCRWWLRTMAELQPDRAWDNRFVRGAFDHLRPRIEQLWREKEHFLTALAQVPQVFSHFDYQRRNLFIRARADGTDEIVAVDWAWCGIGPVGGDLFSLIGSSTLLFESEPEHISDLEAVTLDAYLSGLRDAGWDGNAELVRLGYTAWLGLWIGASAPTMTAVWTADERAGEDNNGAVRSRARSNCQRVGNALRLRPRPKRRGPAADGSPRAGIRQWQSRPSKGPACSAEQLQHSPDYPQWRSALAARPQGAQATTTPPDKQRWLQVRAGLWALFDEHRPVAMFPWPGWTSEIVSLPRKPCDVMCAISLERSVSEQWLAPRHSSSGSLRDLMTHIVSCERGWIAYVQGREIEDLHAKDFPSVAPLRETWQSVDEVTKGYLQSLDDAALARHVAWTGTDGETHDYPQWKMLLHQANHAMQHRSEAALMLSDLGASTDWMDYLIFVSWKERPWLSSPA